MFFSYNRLINTGTIIIYAHLKSNKQLTKNKQKNQCQHKNINKLRYFLDDCSVFSVY
ncbi:hypothetical protein XENE109146_16875 [Xenorhabdus nematophila]